MTILILLLYTYISRNRNAIIDKLLIRLGLDLSNFVIKLKKNLEFILYIFYISWNFNFF